MSWRSLAMRRAGLLRNSRCLCFIAGMAFFWPMLRAPFLGTIFSGEVAGSDDARLFCDSAVVALGLLLLLYESERIPRLLKGGLFGIVPLASNLAVFAAVLCLSVGRIPSFSHGFLLVAGSALFALGFAGTALCWGVRVSCLSAQQAVCCAPASLLLSFLLGLFDSAPSLLLFVCFGLPVGSAISFALFDRCSGASACAVGEEDPPSSSENPVGEGLAFRCVLACVIIGLIACVFVRALWHSEAVGYSFRPLLALTYVESAVMSLLLVAFAFSAKNGGYALLVALASLMLLLVCGVALVALAGVSPALGVIATAHTLLEFVMLSFFLVLSMGNLPRYIRLFGLFEIVEGATSALTAIIVPRLLGAVSGSIEVFASGVSIASLCVVAVGFAVLVVVLAGELGRRVVFAAGERPVAVAEASGGHAAGADAANAADADAVRGVEVASGVVEAAGASLLSPDDLDVASGKMSEAYGLTAREAEVAVLVGRGHSVKKTAELLCLSPNTVSGYMKIIYRKMDVHRKQDLVDAVSRLA